MSNLIIITPEKKAQNKVEFDKLTNQLNGINNILSKIKTELFSTHSKFISMLDIVNTYTDVITDREKQLYDVQCKSMLYSIQMFVNIKNSENALFINPVSDENETTDINLTINFPNYTITRTLTQLDNISVNFDERDIIIGTMIVNIKHSCEIVTELSKDEFIGGILGELEKIILINSQICRMEQHINANMKYIAELKKMGIYN